MDIYSMQYKINEWQIIFYFGLKFKLKKNLKIIIINESTHEFADWHDTSRLLNDS